MIFYHFTDLEALIGLEGREALSKAEKDRSDDVDVAGFAAPGSILADGIKPSLGQDDDNFVHLLRRPLPPVVWLTINPDWIEGFGPFRLTVGVLSDHRLVHWPKYVRKPCSRLRNVRTCWPCAKASPWEQHVPLLRHDPVQPHSGRR